MTACSRILNTIGLVLVLIGCVLLFCFGLPPGIDPSGATYLIGERSDEAEIAKGKRYRIYGRIGISLVALGSVFQIFSLWV